MKVPLIWNILLNLEEEENAHIDTRTCRIHQFFKTLYCINIVRRHYQTLPASNLPRKGMIMIFRKRRMIVHKI